MERYERPEGKWFDDKLLPNGQYFVQHSDGTSETMSPEKFRLFLLKVMNEWERFNERKDHD